MQTIDISIQDKKAGELFFDPLKKDYGFNYTCESSPISLTMPYQKSTYTSHYHLHPIFEMNLPERDTSMKCSRVF